MPRYSDSLIETYEEFEKRVEQEKREERENEIVQALILKALEEHPEGLTTKQIHKAVKSKLKKIKKIQKLLDSIL